MYYPLYTTQANSQNDSSEVGHRSGRVLKVAVIARRHYGRIHQENHCLPHYIVKSCYPDWFVGSSMVGLSRHDSRADFRPLGLCQQHGRDVLLTNQRAQAHGWQIRSINSMQLKLHATVLCCSQDYSQLAYCSPCGKTASAGSYGQPALACAQRVQRLALASRCAR